PSKFRKMFITLGIVVVAAVALVFIAQWLRNLDPVANFIATYNGTPTHPDGVEPGVPGWVGWQHFLNFFIIVMVLRSGFIIRNQQRPEAYWTPKQGGLYSPKHNAPQKVSIQQWIHQTFNILWVANGLIFYVMVFATGHWMRIVPTNWDIFPISSRRASNTSPWIGPRNNPGCITTRCSYSPISSPSLLPHRSPSFPGYAYPPGGHNTPNVSIRHFL